MASFRIRFRSKRCGRLADIRLPRGAPTSRRYKSLRRVRCGPVIRTGCSGDFTGRPQWARPDLARREPPVQLLGRRAEREAVDRLLAQARAGHSGALVVRGEAGMGKSALMEHARETAAAAGFRVEVSTGVESETQFAFAGVHQLCAPMLDRARELPEPQQDALAVAFGQRHGAAPENFLVGLAILNLLAEVTEDGPLLCLVDDAQWLDQASAQLLAFVARRLGAEPVALVFAVRDSPTNDDHPLTGLPELCLSRLGEVDARELLQAAVRAPLDDRVRDRIVAEARGNPLALLELPQAAPVAQLAGGFQIPEDALSVPRRVEDSFRRRSASLPADTRLLLLMAAAEPTGEAALLWRAATHLGMPHEAAAPAETSGLLEIRARVRFRHPLVRSAVYRAASPPDKRRVHGALAKATDPRTDPDRHAWHYAQSFSGPDEEAAAGLEHSAGRARARGGAAAAAAFLRHAAELTPDAAVRATRALEAAYASHSAGASDAALELLASAEAGPLDALQCARIELLRAQIAFHTTRGSEGATMLLDAARTLGPLDAALAREAYVQALEASFHAGRLSRGRGLREVAEAAAQEAPPPPTPPRPVDLLLDGLTTRFTHGYEASVPTLRLALEALCHDDAAPDEDNGRWLWLACHVSVMLWDDESFFALASGAVRNARETGALSALPAALNAMSVVLVLTGELSRAAELLSEDDEISRATGAPPLPNARFILAAWRGRQSEATALNVAVVADATRRGEGTTLGSSEVSMAYLHNGLGDYPAALASATPSWEHDDFPHSSSALPELVEAASRAGDLERAAGALEELSSRARASGTEFALGLAARSRALTTVGPDAEVHYCEAIERLARCRMATHLARAHLVYGEWLRRQGRRQDAREQLRTAHDLLSAMGAEAFAARAARELRATGEHPRKRTARPSDDLTAQELRIARLVATGATSREVAAQLFLSPRTIEAHLRNIFRKLDITSRRQLRELPLP
ncbi:ATP-binding protein [Aeromicrobium chenweiae]|uniref:LuxR family transcriptional regulator n=2 Tax=Aeromicrobium chenweiae TaxID=2079793 RepID=A0A2S0WS29_9ACTN|nr:LuxR family transcriptional regulator [Aeromicrobium chenweiae]TGN31557.1 helix-turn-helix transcriptional regulator [Aeromicrobium chenweiae]